MKHAVVNVTLCCSVSINIDELAKEIGHKPTQKEIEAYAASITYASAYKQPRVSTQAQVFDTQTTYAGEYDGDEHGNVNKRPPPRKGIGSY